MYFRTLRVVLSMMSVVVSIGQGLYLWGAESGSDHPSAQVIA